MMDDRSLGKNVFIAFILLLIFIVLPLVMIFMRSFQVDGEWSFLAPLITLSERSLLQVLLNSILLGIAVVITSTILAAPMAFVMSKTNMNRHSWIDVVLLVPFMTPPYIAAMGWILVMQPRGFLDQFLPFLSFLRPLFFSFWGIVFIMSLNLFPLPHSSQ